MAKYTNSYSVTIDLKPWLDSGFVFTKLHITEELGGKISGGTIDLDHDGSSKALELITEQYTGQLIIEKDRGYIYNIDIFITSKRFYKNSLSLEFVCIKDKKFFTELVTAEWSDITTALNSLYPGNIDLRCESDVNNDLKLFQNTETNYDFCKKLAYSFKKNTIFSFGWEGFMLKELMGKYDSQGNVEPKMEIKNLVDIFPIDSYNLMYNKRIYHESFNPWEPDYTDLVAEHNKSIKFYDSYLVVGTDYYRLIENYWNNIKYMQTDLFTSFRAVISDIPNYKIGDVIKYDWSDEESQLPFRLFLVKSNELFLSIDGSNLIGPEGLNFSWTTKLVGLEEKGSTLPIEDPTNNI